MLDGDNLIELECLMRMLARAGGFTLAFVRVNHVSLREAIVAAVGERLPGRQILDFTLAAMPENGIIERGVVTQLEQYVGQRHPDAMFVYGLETMFDPALEGSAALEILNLNRGYFGKKFPWPMVFCLPDFGMREMIRRAPDFWAWRSGTYHFVGGSEDARQTVERLAEGFDWNLSLREKHERKEVLEHLLAEAESGAAGQAPAVMAALLSQLSEASRFEGNQNQRRRYLEQALPLYREIGHRLGEANCVKALGDVALRQDRYQDAASLFQQALPLYRQIGDRLGEAGCLWSMARLELARCRPEAAQEPFDRAACLYEAIELPQWAERVRAEARNALEPTAP